MRGYGRYPYEILEILCFTSRTYRGGKLLDGMIRRKFTKADVIKRIMKEQKEDFGPLLETRKEKIRRIKREKKGIFTEHQVECNVDSEFSWISKISDSRLRYIKFNENHKELPDFVAPKTSPDGFSSTPVFINEKKSSKIKTMKENAAAPLINDSELSQVQTKIIRRNSTSKAASKSLPEFVITEDDTNKMKSELSQKRLIHEICRSKIAIKVPKQIKEESLISKQFKESGKAECAKISLVSSKLLDNSRDAIELKCQERAPLPLELQLENIEKAMIFNENKKDCANVWHSSRILSIATMENKESLVFPSVTRILNVTMSDKSKKNLELWMKKMIALLGQEGFDKYKRDLLENGKMLHSSIESVLRKIPFEVPETLQPCFNSVQSVLDEVTHVKAIESHVVHPDLGYRGIFDCVASYRGNVCLIDWKKSDKTKNLLSSTYDAPLQLASYIGAVNADKNYPFQIKSGLLVFANTAGNPPTVHELNETKLQYYWKQWLERLKKYFAMQNT